MANSDPAGVHHESMTARPGPPDADREAPGHLTLGGGERAARGEGRPGRGTPGERAARGGRRQASGPRGERDARGEGRPASGPRGTRDAGRDTRGERDARREGRSARGTPPGERDARGGRRPGRDTCGERDARGEMLAGSGGERYAQPEEEGDMMDT
jgi:hypothetical protein